jgi:hypothetical protein
MKKILFNIILLFSITCFSQKNTITFEKSNGKQSSDYYECIKFYKALDALYPTVQIKLFDTTDAGEPLHLVLFSKNGQFNPVQWHNQNKVVILINNGIHPGEPDGIDASMLLLRDLTNGSLKTPDNVVIGIIPVYNIGGSLNRSPFSRVNQQGPELYGFRGNSQNLDLNRDFIKSDTKEAAAFARIFHWLNPDILIDNHVSDGADYQHTMTLLTTQHNKLGGAIGSFLHNTFEPALFAGMEAKNWPMCPYVNFEEGNPGKGWEAFYDPPRYSSGYAALFQTMAFMPETHMLKPFADRVKSTYALLTTFLEKASFYANDIITNRKTAIKEVKKQQTFGYNWKADTSKFDIVKFKGYAADSAISAVTGFKRLFYNHEKPFELPVRLYDYFQPTVMVNKPKAYIIPIGWHKALDLLRLNGIAMQTLKKDTTILVEYYHIDNYKSYSKPYEKHHPNYDIQLSTKKDSIHFLKGDLLVYTGQSGDAYLMEVLEPLSDDSFFRWNFFDAILQQKEGYSNYRWEDVAASFLEQHPEVKQQLEEKKQADKTFAASAYAQLYFVYTHSPYYEPAHLRYPVYRLTNN